MTKEKEKSELEIISDYMDYLQYTVITKWEIKLRCELRRSRYSITPEFLWEWEIRWIISESCWDLCWNTQLIYSTQWEYSLERCISLMNEYIKDNFKTKLD